MWRICTDYLGFLFENEYHPFKIIGNKEIILKKSVKIFDLLRGRPRFLWGSIALWLNSYVILLFTGEK